MASGVADTNDPDRVEDFSSRNEDRISLEKVPMLDPAWLMKLPKGQAFALLEGGRLMKIRIPLPLPHVDARTPANWQAMLSHMRMLQTQQTDRSPERDLTVEGKGSGH
ncbi:MAG: hypothetical protein C4K60_20040 [Ideonella sp. MAG2]|nr:MAG: hypothetical protein C4K60_20040 [Ideonella sp. MAG2]